MIKLFQKFASREQSSRRRPQTAKSPKSFLQQRHTRRIERVNNEISVLENNYREQTKEFQRQVQTSKETVENLKEQLEQAGSTIEINYIKKQMRDELNRQQLAEKDFDILTDKHNQTIKTLNQEIQRYDEETKKAKEAMEVAMLSEFNTYSVKVYDNLEKIVDERMQDRVDGYKDQIKGLEIELEEKNEELENVYTRYQEALTQMPGTASPIANDMMETEPTKKGKKKKKSSNDNFQMDDGMAQQDAYYGQEQYYDQNTEQYGEEYYDEQGEYNNQEYAEGYDYNEYGDYNQQYAEDGNYDQQYAPVDGEYAPVDGEYAPTEEYYGEETYVPAAEEYTPADYTQNEAEYVPQSQEVPAEENNTFNDKDFNVEFENAQKSSENFEDMNFSFDLFDNKEETKSTSNEQQASQNDDNFDLNAILGLYDEKDKPANNGVEELKEDINELTEETENFDEDAEGDDTIAELVVKRKAGRPRKIIDESEIKPKRKPGRPRKDDSLKVVKKTTGKRGRPRKDDSLKVVKTTTGKRGRPRNPVDSGLTINEHGVLAKPIRKAARPKKYVYCD